VGRIPTLYDLLGVSPDASADEVRAAYRRAARAHHPDRHGDAASAQMADINHAWRMLGDERRRREYDLSLADPTVTSIGSSARPQSTRPPGAAEPAFNPLARYQDPPRFPWRFMAVMALVGTAFVMLGVFTTGDPKPHAVDNVLHAGDCVVIEANGDASERLCSDPHDGVVEVFLSNGSACPADTEPHRDLLGMGIACVRRLTTSGAVAPLGEVGNSEAG
jgi:hypothetical protein